MRPPYKKPENLEDAAPAAEKSMADLFTEYAAAPAKGITYGLRHLARDVLLHPYDSLIAPPIRLFSDVQILAAGDGSYPDYSLDRNAVAIAELNKAFPSIYQDARIRMSERVEALRSAAKAVAKASGSERVEMISSAAAQIIATRALTGGVRRLVNYSEYGLANPPVFHNTELRDWRAFPPPIQKLSLHDIRAQKRTKDLLYNITADGELQLAHMELPWALGDAFFDKSYISHAELAARRGVFAAGQLVVEKGKIISANNMSGHYLPFGNHLEKLVTKIFVRNGFPEVRGRFELLSFENATSFSGYSPRFPIISTDPLFGGFTAPEISLDVLTGSRSIFTEASLLARDNLNFHYSGLPRFDLGMYSAEAQMKALGILGADQFLSTPPLFDVPIVSSDYDSFSSKFGRAAEGLLNVLIPNAAAAELPGKMPIYSVNGRTNSFEAADFWNWFYRDPTFLESQIGVQAGQFANQMHMAAAARADTLRHITALGQLIEPVPLMRVYEAMHGINSNISARQRFFDAHYLAQNQLRLLGKEGLPPLYRPFFKGVDPLYSWNVTPYLDPSKPVKPSGLYVPDPAIEAYKRFNQNVTKVIASNFPSLAGKSFLPDFGIYFDAGEAWKNYQQQISNYLAGSATTRYLTRALGAVAVGSMIYQVATADEDKKFRETIRQTALLAGGAGGGWMSGAAAAALTVGAGPIGWFAVASATLAGGMVGARLFDINNWFGASRTGNNHGEIRFEIFPMAQAATLPRTSAGLRKETGPASFFPSAAVADRQPQTTRFTGRSATKVGEPAAETNRAVGGGSGAGTSVPKPASIPASPAPIPKAAPVPPRASAEKAAPPKDAPKAPSPGAPKPAAASVDAKPAEAKKPADVPKAAPVPPAASAEKTAPPKNDAPKAAPPSATPKPATASADAKPEEPKKTEAPPKAEPPPTTSESTPKPAAGASTESEETKKPAETKGAKMNVKEQYKDFLKAKIAESTNDESRQYWQDMYDAATKEAEINPDVNARAGSAARAYGSGDEFTREQRNAVLESAADEIMHGIDDAESKTIREKLKKDLEKAADAKQSLEVYAEFRKSLKTCLEKSEKNKAVAENLELGSEFLLRLAKVSRNADAVRFVSVAVAGSKVFSGVIDLSKAAFDTAKGVKNLLKGGLSLLSAVEIIASLISDDDDTKTHMDHLDEMIREMWKDLAERLIDIQISLEHAHEHRKEIDERNRVRAVILLEAINYHGYRIQNKLDQFRDEVHGQHNHLQFLVSSSLKILKNAKAKRTVGLMDKKTALEIAAKIDDYGTDLAAWLTTVSADVDETSAIKITTDGHFDIGDKALVTKLLEAQIHPTGESLGLLRSIAAVSGDPALEGRHDFKLVNTQEWFDMLKIYLATLDKSKAKIAESEPSRGGHVSDLRKVLERAEGVLKFVEVTRNSEKLFATLVGNYTAALANLESDLRRCMEDERVAMRAHAADAESDLLRLDEPVSLSFERLKTSDLLKPLEFKKVVSRADTAFYKSSGLKDDEWYGNGSTVYPGQIIFGGKNFVLNETQIALASRQPAIQTSLFAVMSEPLFRLAHAYNVVDIEGRNFLGKSPPHSSTMKPKVHDRNSYWRLHVVFCAFTEAGLAPLGEAIYLRSYKAETAYGMAEMLDYVAEDVEVREGFHRQARFGSRLEGASIDSILAKIKLEELLEQALIKARKKLAVRLLDDEKIKATRLKLESARLQLLAFMRLLEIPDEANVKWLKPSELEASFTALGATGTLKSLTDILARLSPSKLAEHLPAAAGVGVGAAASASDKKPAERIKDQLWEKMKAVNPNMLQLVRKMVKAKADISATINELKTAKPKPEPKTADTPAGGGAGVPDPESAAELREAKAERAAAAAERAEAKAERVAAAAERVAEREARIKIEADLAAEREARIRAEEAAAADRAQLAAALARSEEARIRAEEATAAERARSDAEWTRRFTLFEDLLRRAMPVGSSTVEPAAGEARSTTGPGLF